MRKICFFIVFSLVTIGGTFSQTTINPIISNSVLTSCLQGFGLTISNMSITAAPGSLAFFSSTSPISFGSGIIMSTGKVDSLIMNSPASDFISYDQSYNGDLDLDVISGGTTYDACTIEFDCIPANANLLFDFAFASEEYPEFTGGINDVFAILVTGMNPSGGNYINQNFALVPGTSIPVSIMNINNGQSNTGPCMNCSYYVDNSADTTSPFDGYTTGLQGLVNVISGQTYHFKITIADNADAIYDSGVLLKTYSFRSALITDTKTISNSIGNVTVYPIPSNDKIYYYADGFKASKVELYTIDGKKLENIKLDLLNSSIDIKGLAEGIYFIHLSNDQNKIVKKVLIN